MGGNTDPALDAGADGGGNKAALSSAVNEARAFNTSWKDAIKEISGALMSEVGILEDKLKAANDAVEKITKERDKAIEKIRNTKPTPASTNSAVDESDNLPAP